VVITQSKKLAILAVVVGIVSIVLGSIFIAQGFAKSNVITEAMVSENITYSGAGGTIVGIIDTPEEAQAMADILQEHRQALGSYSQLKRDDPNRQTILNAMTMENSLDLAQMGYGLVQVVEASGAFMILIGLTLGAGGVAVIVSRHTQETQ
jgi:uncharacterized membrane protein YphA (DoxX/SURF4 family)